jgi:hypothetical protein
MLIDTRLWFKAVGEYSRQLDIHATRRVLAVVEGGMVVKLEAGLHAIVVVELDEGETAALLGSLGLSRNANRGGRVLLEVLCERFEVCGVGKVACNCDC